MSNAGQEGSHRAVTMVEGRSMETLPADLYIPPDALVVFLETFTGPLDLLLYLIRRRNLDLLAVSVAKVTEQYLSYIDLMAVLKLDLAGEYLAMAATLTAIKSSLLLPRHQGLEDEEDPRAELLRRLQEYERVKETARQLGELPRLERDIFAVQPQRPELVKQYAEPQVALKELLVALADVMRRAERFKHHQAPGESLSVRERMASVLDALAQAGKFVRFERLCKPQEGRAGLVVTFLAITELLREGLLTLTQAKPFAPIYLCAANA